MMGSAGENSENSYSLQRGRKTPPDCHLGLVSSRGFCGRAASETPAL